MCRAILATFVLVLISGCACPRFQSGIPRYDVKLTRANDTSWVAVRIDRVTGKCSRYLRAPSPGRWVPMGED